MTRIHDEVKKLLMFNGDRPFIDHIVSRDHKFAVIAVKLSAEERKNLENFDWLAPTVIGSPTKIALILKIKPHATTNTNADLIGDFAITFKDKHVAVGWRRRYDDFSEMAKVKELLDILSLSYLNAEDVIGHLALNDADWAHTEEIRKMEIPADVLEDDKNHMYKLRLGDGAGTSVGDGYGFKKLRG